MTDPLTGLTPAPVTDELTPEFVTELRQKIVTIEAAANTLEPASTATTHFNGWHLAQLNLGVFKLPLDAPEMAPFVDALDRINGLADESPGFVWRLQGDDGEPSSYVEVPGADDPLLASNLSVWTDLESLRAFMYRTDHASYLRRRAEWFEREQTPMIVAWWIPAGTLPTLADAIRRLDHLRAHGPSDEGFPLGRTIPDPPTDSPSNTAHPNQLEPTMSAPQVLIPYLTVSDSRAAVAFYGEVFGATQQKEWFEMDDGRIGHVEMNIGGQIMYMADEFSEMNLQSPANAGSNSVSMVINVDDCDAVYERAVAAGATGERPPSNQHGNRSGWFVDPWGHRWSPTSAERS